MKRLLPILAFALVALYAWPQQVITARRRVSHGGAAPTWAFVQDASILPCSADPCVVNLTNPSTAGSVMVVELTSTTASNTITAVSDGVGGTWTTCTGCAVNSANSALGSISAAYIVGSPGGATSVSVTDSLSNIEFIAVAEFKCTANCTSLAFDQAPSSFGDLASCGTCTMSGFTGAASSALVINVINVGSALPTTPSTGYVIAPTGLFIYDLAAASGTAGTVVQSPSSTFLSSGVSFR